MVVQRLPRHAGASGKAIDADVVALFAESIACGFQQTLSGILGRFNDGRHSGPGGNDKTRLSSLVIQIDIYKVKPRNPVFSLREPAVQSSLNPQFKPLG